MNKENPETEFEIFGKKLAQLRIKSGFKSQRKFARETGISHTSISNIESGITKPRPETLKVMSEFLIGVTYEGLLEELGYIENNKPYEENTGVDNYHLKSIKKQIATVSPHLVKNAEAEEQFKKITTIFKKEQLDANLTLIEPLDITNYMLNSSNLDALLKYFDIILHLSYKLSRKFPQYKLSTLLNFDLSDLLYIMPDEKMQGFGLKKGSLLIVEEVPDYQNEEIIVLRFKETNQITVRKAIKVENNLILLSSDFTCPSVSLTESEYELIGRVNYNLNMCI